MNPPLADGSSPHNSNPDPSSSPFKTGSSRAPPDSNSPRNSDHQKLEEVTSALPRFHSRDPEYVPPKRVLDALKKSDDLASDIIVNVKRRTLRRAKKLDQDVDPSMSFKGEQFFADLEMSTPISTEQLRQILEDSACEEAKNLGRKQHGRRRAEKSEETEKSEGTEKGEGTEKSEAAEKGEGKMPRGRPPLKIKLRKLGKRTCSSPARSRKDSNSETDGGSQCNVPKDNVLPKAHVQKFNKGPRRKRQTCRKQFRHKDITLYKLGAGQEKSSVPKNQVIHKIFARRSSTSAVSPPAAKTETDTPQEEVSEQNLPVADVKSGDSNKCSENFTLNNSISTRIESKSNNEYPNKAKFPSSAVKTTTNELHAEIAPKNGQNYSFSAKRRDSVIPQLQIRDETPPSLNSSTTAPAGHQMVSRNEIGKHNLPIRIPERRTSIAEPLRTPPVLSKVPSFHLEKHTETRSNSMNAEAKDGTVDKSEVISSKSGSSQDKSSEVTKLKENQLTATPFVKLCRLPDNHVSSQKVIDSASENHEENADSFSKKDLIETKNIQIDAVADQPKPNYAHVQTNGVKSETNGSIYKYNDNSSVLCSPENLSIKVFKSCSGITDPLKLHRPLYLQNKKNELNSKNRNSSTTPRKEGNQRSENQDVFQSPSCAKVDVDVRGINYKNSPILQQNLLLKPGYKIDPYGSIPLPSNSNTLNNPTQEMPPYSSANASGSNSEVLYTGTHNLPRNMPIIEDANQQAFGQTVDNTGSESSKKYKRGKRKSSVDTLEGTPPKLYRGNNYQPYNSYPYPLHIYAGSHPHSPYGSLPPFSIGAPPPPYNFCPPIYQPRQSKQPQPPASGVRCEAPAFSNSGARPIMPPFLTHEPPLPYALPNTPSSEAYNTRINYENLLRLNSAVFANRGPPRNLDYISTAGNSRKKAVQNMSPTVIPDSLDFSLANFPRNNTRQNFYPPFAIPEAHQQPPKVTDTQTIPLALIKNVTTSHCGERNIPIISRNEELTITKVPMKENSTHSSLIPKGHEIANLIPFSKRIEFQKNDKPKLELHNGGINSLIKVSKGSTEFIGPLRHSPSKIEIPHKALYSIPEPSFPSKFAHSELASISVSIVKSNDKHSPVQQSKPVMASHTSALPLSEQIKLLESERAHFISQKSESASYNSNTKYNNNADCSVTQKEVPHVSPPDKQIINCQTPKSDRSINKDEVRENVRLNCSSPHSVSGSSTITDVERESEVEEASSVITIITDEKEQNYPKASEGNITPIDASQPNEATLSPKIGEFESETPDIFSQVTDELISGILSQPSTRKEFIKSLHALTFIVNNMLYNSDRISEDEKNKLRHMLEGPIRNFNAETPCSSDMSDSVPSLKKTEIIATMQNVIKHNSTITSAKKLPESELCSTEINEEKKSHIENKPDASTCAENEPAAVKSREPHVISSAPTSPAQHKNIVYKEDKGIHAESLNVSLEQNEILKSTVTNASTITQSLNIHDVTVSSNNHDKQNTSKKPDEAKPVQKSSKQDEISIKEVQEITGKNQSPVSNEFKGETIRKMDITSVTYQSENSATPSCNVNIQSTNSPKTDNSYTNESDVSSSEAVSSPFLPQESSSPKSSDPSMATQSSIEVECSSLNNNKLAVNMIKKVVAEDKGAEGHCNSDDTSSTTSYSANAATPSTNGNAIPLPLNCTVNNKHEEKHSPLRQFRISSTSHGKKCSPKVNEAVTLEHSSNSGITQNSILNLAVNASVDKEKGSEYTNDEKHHLVQSRDTAQRPRILSVSETKQYCFDVEPMSSRPCNKNNSGKNDSFYNLTSETERTENISQISQSYPVIKHSTILEEPKEMKKVEVSQISRLSSPLDGMQNNNNNKNIDDLHVIGGKSITEEKKFNIQTSISNSNVSRRNSSNEEIHYDKSIASDTVTTSFSQTKMQKCQLTGSNDIENSSGENVEPLNDVCLHKQDDGKILTEMSPNLSPVGNIETISSKPENLNVSKSNHIDVQLCNTQESNLDQNILNYKGNSRAEESGSVIQMLPVIQHHNSKSENSHDGTNSTFLPNMENSSQDIVISYHSSDVPKARGNSKEPTSLSPLDEKSCNPITIPSAANNESHDSFNNNSGNSRFILHSNIILTPIQEEHFRNRKGNAPISQNNHSPDINTPAMNIASCNTSVNVEYVHKQGIRPEKSKDSLDTTTISPSSCSSLNEYTRDSEVHHRHLGPQITEHLAADRTASNSKGHSQNKDCQSLQRNSSMQPAHHKENNSKINSEWTRWTNNSIGAPMGGYSYIIADPYSQQSIYSGQTLHHRHTGDIFRNSIGARNYSLPRKGSIHDKGSAHVNISQQSPPLNKRSNETSANPPTPYIERNAITELSKNELGTQDSGEKRHVVDESSKATKRKRGASNEKPEMLHKPGYGEHALHQPQIPYSPDNAPFRVYPTYPSENIDCRRPARTHLVNEPSFTRDGVVNYAKSSMLLSPQLHSKPSSEQGAAVSNKGLDMRNPAKEVPARQPLIYNTVDTGNHTNYAAHANYNSVASFRQNSIQERDFPHKSSHGNFSDMQNSNGSVNTRILADLKEKCLRGNRNLQSEANFNSSGNTRLPKDNQNHLRINANVPNFSNNISPDYGYFSPLSKNAPTHFEGPVHHHPPVQYNEANACQNLQYRRLSNSSQHSTADSLESFRHSDIIPNNNCNNVSVANTSGNGAYVKHNVKLSANPLASPVQNKVFQQESSIMPQNYNVQEKISSILPKLQQGGTLTPEQYVAEMSMLEKDGCPRPFMEFYSYVTKKQISSNQLPISFRIFLEFQNAGKLKTFEKAFKIYSEKHEKEKKIIKSN